MEPMPCRRGASALPLFVALVAPVLAASLRTTAGRGDAVVLLPGACTPHCTWVCDSPNCPQSCSAQCAAPRCETRCGPPDASMCSVQCTQPACHVQCPETQVCE